jgi:phage baseplate assembly protein V
MSQSLRSLALRVLNLAVRGTVSKVVDTTKAQGIKVLLRKSEIDDGKDGQGIERMQGYGLTSHPKPGAEVLVISLGGNAAHSIVIQTEDRRYRLTGLAEGEVALYDDQGQRLYLNRDRVLLLSNDSGRPVRLGVTAAGSFESIMAYPDCSQDLVDLEAKVNAILALLRTDLPLISTGIATPPAGSYVPGAIPADASITHGTPAVNAEVEV